MRRISLTVAATAVAAAAVFLASGHGPADGLGTAAATSEPTEGGTVGVTEGGDGGVVSGGMDGGTDGGGTDSGGTVGVSEGSGSASGETTGGGEPSSSPTPTVGPSSTVGPTPTIDPTTPPPTGDMPATAYACWSPYTPLTGTFVALVPAGTLPSGNKATLVELTFAPKTEPETGRRTDDRILTRFAPTGGTWSTADPVPLEVEPTGIKAFRPVVPGVTLKMPEIRLNDVTCWDSTVASLGGTIRFGGEGGNGGPEVKVPVTWQRS
ncbi:hypothetical protein AB0A60_14035 [Streptomyces sp. NPDC046275]|uniref:hypothetical protein n=1 Tax=Streptomyces sp. NPDC046275 TaxID=3157201 RepID=UPI0033FAF3EA